MKGEVFTEFYRGVPVKAFWVRPSTPGPLSYGYRIEGELEVESIGFVNTAQACRHAAKVIDALLSEAGIPEKPRRKRPSLRAQGLNPKALGTNPKALGLNPRALGINPKALGLNPKALRNATTDKIKSLTSKIFASESASQAESPSESSRRVE